MKTLCALVLSLFLAASAHAAEVPVQVSYTITGTSGDYTLDFSFKNNLINSVNAPGDWAFYKLGVALPGTSIIGNPANYPISAPVDAYNHVWTLNLGPGATAAGGLAMFPQTTISGFLVHSSDALPPSVASWFMTGSAGDENGRIGFHSHGRYLGQYLIATFTGQSQGQLQSLVAPSPVPLPPAVLLFGAGLIALVGLGARKWRRR